MQQPRFCLQLVHYKNKIIEHKTSVQDNPNHILISTQRTTVRIEQIKHQLIWQRSHSPHASPHPHHDNRIELPLSAIKSRYCAWKQQALRLSLIIYLLLSFSYITSTKFYIKKKGKRESAGCFFLKRLTCTRNRT